jgi:hypothetical protein
LAGVNPVAVDRVGLQVMKIPQSSVPHLAYASQRGLGPPNASNIRLLGDPFIPIPLTPAVTGPVVWQPQASPVSISLSAGEQTTVSYKMPVACFTRVEIIQDNDATPAVTLVRTLRDWGQRPAGVESLIWDGTDDNGNQVSPGSYLVRVQGRTTPTSSRTTIAVKLLSVRA